MCLTGCCYKSLSGVLGCFGVWPWWADCSAGFSGRGGGLGSLSSRTLSGPGANGALAPGDG